jgi:hypothetical protein
LRARPANDGVGSVAAHPHDRLNSGSHYISHCFFRCITGCQPPLLLSGRSLGWRHWVRLRYNPPSARENRPRRLGLRRNPADLRRPVSSNGPLFRRGEVVWDVEGTIAAEYRANVTARYSAAARSCGMSKEQSRRNTGLTFGRSRKWSHALTRRERCHRQPRRRSDRPCGAWQGPPRSTEIFEPMAATPVAALLER